MTAQIITLSPSIFIDVEGACIPYHQQAVEKVEQIKRAKTAFSEMKTGKFRKLFNRHTMAYR